MTRYLVDEDTTPSNPYTRRRPDMLPTGWQGQTPEYRRIRDELLAAESELINQRERVATLRRSLPLGAEIPTDYVFHEGPQDITLQDPDTIRPVRFSQLFTGNRDSLIVVHTMFDDDSQVPCPACNMWADGYNAIAPHVSSKVNFVLVAKKEIQALRRWACDRGWDRIRILSSAGTTFNRDYGVETTTDGQLPAVSIFRRSPSGNIHHFYTTLGSLVHTHHRAIDLFSPVWHLFDLLPEGRETWVPRHSYD